MGTIFVIGNGFDLNCGLNTKYSDFFNWCLTNVPGYKGIKNLHPQSILMDMNIREAIEEKGFTVWYLYFILKASLFGKNDWCNIEEEIKESFESGFWDGVLSDINYFLSNDEWGVHDEDWYFAYMMYSRYFDDGKYFFRKDFPREFFETRVISEQEFYDALLKELNQVEGHFSNFLASEVSAKESIYAVRQFELLDKLTKLTSSEEPVNVVSFNYTEIVPGTDEKRIQSNNIHGVLTGKPIFGISSIGNRDSSKEQFTKAHRRMIDNLVTLGEFIKGDDHSIVFYGTSLNDLDYDYYYNILRLFNKTKTIHFCYSNFDGTDHKNEQVKLVKKLIDKIYFGTFYQLVESERVKITLIK